MTGKLNADVGRPQNGFDRHVSEALIGAALQLLRDRPRGNIAISEIAAGAGVSKAMVRYYFNNKESLFEIILENFVEDLFNAFVKLEAAVENFDPAKSNPTRLLISTISGIYAEHQAGLRLLITEIFFDSDLKRHYLERLALRPTVVLQRIIKRFVDLGVYRPDLDPAYAALTLEWALSHDAVTGCITSPLFKLRSGSCGAENWLDHISEIIDRGFRSSAA